ncbi:MAG: hypothetical protein AAFV45_15005 [Pseudomonadota bacterium]
MTKSIKLKNGKTTIPVNSVKFAYPYAADELERMSAHYGRDCSQLTFKLELFNGAEISVVEDAEYLAKNGLALVSVVKGKMINAHLVAEANGLSDKDKAYLDARAGEKKPLKSKVQLMAPDGSKAFVYSTVPHGQFSDRVATAMERAAALKTPANDGTVEASAPEAPAQG